MSIVFAIFLTTGCSLIPIILYYANLDGNNVPIDPEYSQERNASRAKVHIHNNYTVLMNMITHALHCIIQQRSFVL